MKFQVTYQTNADYIETWNKLLQDPRVEYPKQSRKGHLFFRFRSSNLKVELVEATRKLVIFYENEKEKGRFFSLLKELLVTKDGSPIVIEPIHTNVYRIPYLHANNFKFYWCDKKFNYEKVNINHLPKKEKQLWNLNVEFYEILTKISLEKENLEGSLFGSLLFLIHEPESMISCLQQQKT